MRNLAYSLVVSAILVGCGSTVPLTDVPVSDGTVNPVSSTAATDGVSGVNNGGLAPDDLGQSGSKAALESAKRIVYFDYDSFVINPDYQALVSENARMILGQADRKVAIEGHTDERGGREYNLALGQKARRGSCWGLGDIGRAQAPVGSCQFWQRKTCCRWQ